jgi:signal transduction histidine kinase/CheY-like chemotaxis protein
VTENENEADVDFRILLRTATSMDALMASAVLERAGFAAFACETMQRLTSEFAIGAGAILLAEEVIAGTAVAELAGALAQQPPWSDVPVIVLARQGMDTHAIVHVMDEVPNVTVIERPMRVASLVSAVRTAMRSRRRQYELRSLLDGLREADQRKTEFLATLAHELRNPLAPLSTALALLARRKPSPEDADKYHDLMRRQVDHMVRLVNDLMEVSRITRGKIQLRLGPVRLDMVIEDAIELSRPLIEEAKHSLSVDITPEPLVVRGDAVRLTQVFSNLLNNAAKYTRAGGQLKLSAFADERQAVIQVTDSGTGLAPNMLKSIFDMFVQVSGTARQAQGGLGIGLTLVKSLVELHGGSVEATSEGLDRGATFTVRFPLAKQNTVPDGHAERRGRVTTSIEGTILVVDDNRDAADSLSELLSSMGAESLVAYSGEEALRLARQNPVGTAILDIGMPGMDGCDLARHLRAEPDGAAMKLIALTGWGQLGLRERIETAGFDHHLLKPVNLEHLLVLL